MINLSDWLAVPSDQPIVLEGEGVKDFCDVLDRYYEKFDKADANKARVAKLRSAIKLTGADKGDFGPHFGRFWTAEYTQ